MFLLHLKHLDPGYRRNLHQIYAGIVRHQRGVPQPGSDVDQHLRLGLNVVHVTDNRYTLGSVSFAVHVDNFGLLAVLVREPFRANDHGAIAPDSVQRARRLGRRRVGALFGEGNPLGFFRRKRERLVVRSLGVPVHLDQLVEDGGLFQPQRVDRLGGFDNAVTAVGG